MKEVIDYVFWFNGTFFEFISNNIEYNVATLKAINSIFKSRLEKNKMPVLIKDVLIYMGYDGSNGYTEQMYRYGWSKPEELSIEILRSENRDQLLVVLENVKKIF